MRFSSSNKKKIWLKVKKGRMKKTVDPKKKKKKMMRMKKMKMIKREREEIQTAIRTNNYKPITLTAASAAKR